MVVIDKRKGFEIKIQKTLWGEIFSSLLLWQQFGLALLTSPHSGRKNLNSNEGFPLVGMVIMIKIICVTYKGESKSEGLAGWKLATAIQQKSSNRFRIKNILNLII